jgi:uncharacterized repeat protein (TIGR02543 family)
VGADSTVTYEATPEYGANASQPLYVNRAWVVVADSILVPTANGTYHQGAGTGTVTFSAGHGGSIYNAGPQAVDYSTAPREGILVAPDEGYSFAGWSHDEYISHRGKLIAARSGIMYYDTLAVFGDVAFRAEFEINRYPIYYRLNAGENAADNPPVYTVESAPITLADPSKPDDVFIGWSGSNGEEPQLTVTIPTGSTGEREYYANFLYSGRESYTMEAPAADKIWSSGNDAYIRTSRSGSITKVYTPDGILRRQHTILSAGTTTFRLDPGIYIIKLNNDAGQKILIE